MFVYVAAVSIDSICQTIGTAHGCSERPRTPRVEVEAARSDFLARSDNPDSERERGRERESSSCEEKKVPGEIVHGGVHAQPCGVTELPMRLGFGGERRACLGSGWAWASSKAGHGTWTAQRNTAQGRAEKETKYSGSTLGKWRERGQLRGDADDKMGNGRRETGKRHKSPDDQGLHQAPNP